jgi:hypothetical protein
MLMNGKVSYAWILALILSFSCLVVLHHQLQLHHTEHNEKKTTTINARKSVTEAYSSKLSDSLHVSNKCTYAIVLQQSPVYPHQQLDRLRAIDQSWAQWMQYYPKACLIAILPCSTAINNNNSAEGFQFIRYLALSTADCSKENVNPYRNMAETYLKLLIAYPDIEVVTLANDHTFFIIPNWYHFMINSLPQEVLHGGMLYTGNQLALKSGPAKSPTVQQFASGGGGIIMSRNIMEIMAIIWTVLSNDAYLQQLLHGAELANQSLESNRKFDFQQTIDSQSILGMLRGLIIAHSNCLSSEACKLNGLRFLLHGQQNLQIRYPTATTYEVLYTQVSNAQSEQPQIQDNVVTMKLLHKKCYAKDLWSRINPGIVLVQCMFSLFNLTFWNIPQQRHAQNNFLLQASPKIAMLPTEIKQTCGSYGEVFNVFGFVRTVSLKVFGTSVSQ